VVLPDGVRPAAIHIRDGRIASIAPHGDRPAGVREVDAGQLLVLPGLVDTHVHINDPGRADWEGFEHATRAAAAGGVTTLVDMPLNSIPATIDVEALEVKRRAASGRCHVDVGFWAGLVPGNRDALEPLARAGALGFKCFLCPSGVDEFAHVTPDDLRAALPVVARTRLPLLAHAELPSLLLDAATVATATGAGACRRYSTWLASRPPASERAAIDLLVQLARDTAAHMHIVHLASPDALAALDAARAGGVPVTVETCPHYLTFAAKDVPDGATAFKCAPPIRNATDREGLWKGLRAGSVQIVASDHSPSPPAMKHLHTGDFVRAWGGIASLQLALSVVWTGAASRGIPFESLASWMSAAPAHLAGLTATKGAIAAGRDADLVICDPDAAWTVSASSLHHRHSVTPYDGMTLRGVIRTTMLRGEVVFEEGEFRDARLGRLL
jgi:allantoinase